MADKTNFTWEDAELFIKEFVGYTITDHQSNGDLYQIGIKTSVNSGNDFQFILQCEKNNPSSIKEAFKMLSDDFDVDETAADLYEEQKDYGVKIRDALRDAEEMAAYLKNDAIICEQYFSLNQEVSKEIIAADFERFLDINTNHNTIKNEDAFSVCNKTVNSVIWDGGSPTERKRLLTSYLNEIGITDNNPATYANALNKIQLLHNERLLQEKETGIPTKIENRLLSSTESKLIKMFDDLFTKDKIIPGEWVDTIVVPARDPALNKSSPNIWWLGAVNHACNSGGSLWQDSFTRMQIMEKYKLIPKGTCERDSDDPVFEKHFESIDEEYSKHMFHYLRLKNLLDDKKRIEKIQKDNKDPTIPKYCKTNDSRTNDYEFER